MRQMGSYVQCAGGRLTIEAIVWMIHSWKKLAWYNEHIHDQKSHTSKPTASRNASFWIPDNERVGKQWDNKHLMLWEELCET